MASIVSSPKHIWQLAGARRCSMGRHLALLPAVLTSAVFFSGCGGGNPRVSPPPPQAVQPSIAAISPTNVPAGSGSFTLTITGTGLSMSTQVKFGSAVLWEHKPARQAPSDPDSAPNRRRSSSRCDAGLWARDSAGTRRGRWPSARRACAASPCVSSNVVVLDLAS